MLYRTYLPAKILETMLEERVTESETLVYSSPYRNGREKGFCFYVGGRWQPYPAYVYVAQARCSDQIMVTTSAGPEWRDVTDEEYRAAHYFDYNARGEALEHILTELAVLDPTF